MSQTTNHPHSLEDQYMELLPLQFVPPELQRQLRKLAKHFDRIARIEEQTGEVFLDEKDFRHMLMDSGKAFPPDFADAVIAQLQALPGNRLIDARTSKKKLQAVSWAEAAARVDVLAAHAGANTSIDTQGGLERLRTVSSSDELARAFYELFPSAPAALVEPDRFKARFQQVVDSIMGGPRGPAGEVGAQRSIEQIWNCFLSKLGWWGAALAVATVLAVGAALGIFGPFELVIAGVVVAVISGYGVAVALSVSATAAILVGCILGW